MRMAQVSNNRIIFLTFYLGCLDGYWIPYDGDDCFLSRVAHLDHKYDAINTQT